MHKLSITTLRQKLFQVADEVLASGVPVAIERRGKTLLLVAEAAGGGRLVTKDVLVRKHCNAALW